MELLWIRNVDYAEKNRQKKSTQLLYLLKRYSTDLILFYEYY